MSDSLLSSDTLPKCKYVVMRAIKKNAKNGSGSKNNCEKCAAVAINTKNILSCSPTKKDDLILLND